MKINSVNTLKKLRAPTEQEIEAVGKHMRAYYQNSGKILRITSIVLLILGAVFLIGGIGILVSQDWKSGGISSVLGLFCILGFAYSRGSIQRQTHEIARFESGMFLVGDGMVSDIGVNPDTPGMSNVKFTFLDGLTLDGWFKARNEELCIGTPLLLVYISKEKRGREGKFSWVFTPFMLNDKGICLHR